MGQCKPLDLRFVTEFHRVFESAVAPPGLGRVFLAGVLRVMDEEVRARDKSGMLQILTSDFAFAVSQYV